jgi:hypothetical protein
MLPPPSCRTHCRRRAQRRGTVAQRAAGHSLIVLAQLCFVRYRSFLSGCPAWTSCWTGPRGRELWHRSPVALGPGGTARRMAAEQSQTDVVSALTSICLDQSKWDPQLTERVALLKAASSWKRSDHAVDHRG